MNKPTVTRRHALATIGGSIMAGAAAAALPPRTLERVDVESDAPYAGLLAVFDDGRALVARNPLIVRDAAAAAAFDRWAHEQLAQGEILALLDAAELLAIA
jgi:hypothetical protein